jgi:hypothetical protein
MARSLMIMILIMIVLIVVILVVIILIIIVVIITVIITLYSPWGSLKSFLLDAESVFGPHHQQSQGTFFGYTTPDEESKQSS